MYIKFTLLDFDKNGILFFSKACMLSITFAFKKAKSMGKKLRQ